jgi:hypothetical protein
VTFRFLASFHYRRGTDLAAWAASHPGPVEVFADSGAFSAHTKGVVIDLTDYAAWLGRWRALFTVAANLDVIGDLAQTRRNQARLEQLGHRVLPVFHVGTPWEELDRLCTEYDYVALGGMVAHAQRPPVMMRWLIRCFRIAEKHGTRFHGFGQTNPAIIAKLPFYSVDSSAWSRVRFGEMHLWDGQTTKMRVARLGDYASAYKLAPLMRAHGADPALIADPAYGWRKKGVKSKADYYQERDTVLGVNAIAWHRFGEWLTARHAVPPPAGHASTGTCLFLADSGIDLPTAGAAISRTSDLWTSP